MNREYASFEDYPKSIWRWADFTPRELRSKGDGKLMVDLESMDKLQALRTMLGIPIKLTSAYRSAAHNKKVGGAKNSQHLKARAFDCQMPGHDPAQFEAAARQCGFTGFGFYPDSKPKFIHIDTGPTREWGERWFKKADRYTDAKITVKTPPARPTFDLSALIGQLLTALRAIFGGKTK